MDVARPREQRRRHVARPDVGDRAPRGQDRAVRAVAQDHGRAGRPAGRDPARGDVHAAPRQRVEHEPAQRVVADHARPGRPRSPSRAAPQAVIADELPIVSRMPSTNRSAWPNTGPRVRVPDDDVGVDLADDEQVDVAIAGGGAPQYRSYQPGPGGSGRRAAAQRGRHGAPDLVDQLGQPRQPRPPLGPQEAVARRRAPSSPPRPTPTARPARRSRPPRRRPAPGARTSRRRRRPTAAPTAPAWPRPARRTPRASAPRRSTPASYGNSALSTSAPIAVSRRAVSTTTRRRSSPVELPPVEAERQRLQEQGEVLLPAGRGDVGDQPLLVGGVGRVGVVVDEQLGGRRARGA